MFFLSPAILGQSLTLTGKIIDGRHQEPVSYASVYFARSGVEKHPTVRELFLLFNNLKTLVVSYVGYSLYRIPVSSLNNNKPLLIQLERRLMNDGVVVRSKVNKRACSSGARS